MSSSMKRAIKRSLYFLLYYSGLLRLMVFFWSYRKKQHAAILFYHRFRRPGDGAEDLLPRLDGDEFDRQLAYLKETYDVLSLDEACVLIRTGKGFRKPAIVLTIDDGYRDNYTVAFPIIRKHCLPVTIYLAAGFMGGKKGLWVDDIEYALRKTERDTLMLPGIFGEERVDIATMAGKRSAEKRLYHRLAHADSRERRACLREFFAALDLPADDGAGRERGMMNWEEVNEMTGHGITFGAHTMTHPCLASLPLEDAKREILDSRRVVEERTGKEARHFAIPNGKAADFSDELRIACREMGFASVVTTEPGVVNASSDLFSLERIIPPPPMYYFACELARYLFRRGKDNR